MAVNLGAFKEGRVERADNILAVLLQQIAGRAIRVVNSQKGTLRDVIGIAVPLCREHDIHRFAAGDEQRHFLVILAKIERINFYSGVDLGLQVFVDLGFNRSGIFLGRAFPEQFDLIRLQVRCAGASASLRRSCSGWGSVTTLVVSPASACCQHHRHKQDSR
ncbi:hypothetical protein D3C71_1507270 [compost metagenome]